MRCEWEIRTRVLFRAGDFCRHTTRACAFAVKCRRNVKSQDPSYRASGDENLSTVILLQETNVTNPDVLNIPGYRLAEYTSSIVHGVASFVQCPTKWRYTASSTFAEEVEWVTTEVEGVNITNVYKPPVTRLCLDSIPRYQQPCIYAGDFNCHSTTWGYGSTNTDGTTLEHWASNTDVHCYMILNSLVLPPSTMGHIDISGSGFCQSWNMCESASPQTLPEVPAQTIAYRVIDNHQLGANASCQ